MIGWDNEPPPDGPFTSSRLFWAWIFCTVALLIVVLFALGVQV